MPVLDRGPDGAPGRPGAAPVLRGGHLVLVRGQLLRLRAPPPQPVGPAIVRDPRFGGDPGAGQDRDERAGHENEGRGPRPADAKNYPERPSFPLTRAASISW